MLVTQFRGGQSFNVGRSSSSNDSSQETTSSTSTDAKNLNTSTEDGLEIQDVKQPAVQQENVQTTNNKTSEIPLPVVQQDEDDDYYYDDYSWDEGPAEFVDLDAIVQPTSVDRTPVTGLFKLADSNDWIVVEHYYMDHYYFGDLGADFSTKQFVWHQPVVEGDAEKLGAEIKTDE